MYVYAGPIRSKNLIFKEDPDTENHEFHYFFYFLLVLLDFCVNLYVFMKFQHILNFSKPNHNFD